MLSPCLLFPSRPMVQTKPATATARTETKRYAVASANCYDSIMSEPTQSGQSRRGRSPSYPAIDLEAAIGRAKMVYDREQKHPAPVAAVQAHWGFKPNTGPASVTLAALTKFGLLASEGNGEARLVRLTDLALTILLSPDDQTRLAAIQEAAVAPSIHRELLGQYRDSLPSDANLRFELVVKRNFTETGATEFIPQFRRTVAFAQLLEPATVDDKADPGEAEEQGAYAPPADLPLGPEQQSAAGKPSPMLTIPIPLVGSSQVQIAGAFPISEAAWTQLLAVLSAMKPGLVAAAQPEQTMPDQGTVPSSF